MNPRKALCNAFLAFAALAICASAQAAGLFRAYLASDGLDTNPCTVTAPCRLLPAALAAVTDGGEIWMLDSANYNTATVSITKSVTILAIPGAVGSVVSISGNAIDALTPGTTVALRNLVIVPFPGGGGTNGINVNGAAKLTVEDSLIAGHAANGIVVLSQTLVRIINCIVRDNGANGVNLFAGTAEISGSKFLANGTAGVALNGIFGPVTTSAAISDSVLSGNQNGLVLDAQAVSTLTRASITRSTLADNSNNGVFVYAWGGTTALATVGGNMITGNGTGLYQGGAGTATLESLGNNLVRQNVTPTFGTITTVAPM